MVAHGSPPTKHLIWTVDPSGGLLMHYGLFDVFNLIRSEDPDYPVCTLRCGYRKIQVRSFISSIDIDI